MSSDSTSAIVVGHDARPAERHVGAEEDVIGAEEVDRAAQCGGGAREFEQQPVAGAFYDDTVPLLDARLDFSLTQRHPALVCGCFIELHQFGVANDVDENDGCKAPR